MLPARIYDWSERHKRYLWLSLAVISVLLGVLVVRVKYSEDVSAFLPLGAYENEALSVYQEVSGANRIYIMFSNPEGNPDETVEAIDCFVSAVEERDDNGWCSDLTADFDMGQIREITDFVYDNIPFFLEAEDYARMDSLLAEPDYVRKQLERDRRMLMFPSGGFMSANVGKDPLNLFSPVAASLQSSNPQLGFEMYDGHIFSPDMSRAIVMMSSPFGNSETENNSKLLALLNAAISQAISQHPGVCASVTGGPVIAVGNSSRIKTDSIWAIAIASVLIILLLYFSFSSIRDILLILLSIGWGWLFALGGMSLFSDNVSIIVIGISSVILGIAVNYPLHLIAHLSHQPDIRTAVKDISQPLVIGNITTVGAFLALVPLQSTALRDLGLFASLLLVGTIVFVLFYLPHIVRKDTVRKQKNIFFSAVSGFSPDKKTWLIISAVALTAVLSVFSLRTEFDTNIANINYMTPEQKNDMDYFQNLLSKSDSGTGYRELYVISKGPSYDEALMSYENLVTRIDSLSNAGTILWNSNFSRFIVSERVQEQRIQMWKDFVSSHSSLSERLKSDAAVCGFSSDAFSSFLELLDPETEISARDVDFFMPLTKLVFSQNLTRPDTEGECYVVDVIRTAPDKVKEVESLFDNAFDVQSLNNSLAGKLSDSFNYIGWACSIIVFFFLWFSFGRLELAIISFLPMAVSWVWILGIMAILGIKFNIVNIILATFIFGQGDDYTIFMTEGCQYEYTFKRPILSSYKTSIIQSALIMFVGIGSLIVAKHPAMHSLAEVTVIGMFAVVFMAYLIPPFLFRIITTKNGVARDYPVTIRSVICGRPSDAEERVLGRYIYKGRAISRTVRQTLKESGPEYTRKSLAPGEEYRMTDEGYGELGILMALTHPDNKIKVIMNDDENKHIAEVSADGFVNNIEFV